MNGVSSILIATGRLERMHESVQCFLAQDYEEKQLIVFNCCHRQKLVGDFPNVVFINSGQPVMAMRAKNTAIAGALYETIVIWSETDWYSPDHLSCVAEHIGENDWIWFDREWLSDGKKIVQHSQGSEACIAFTKSAWKKADGYQPGIGGADDRNFIARLTRECVGQKIFTKPEEITFVRVGTEAQKQLVKPSIVSGVIKIMPQSKHDYAAQIQNFGVGKTEKKICIIELGRIGDILNILPFIKLVHDEYAKPDVFIAREFLPIFDGISYCNPVVAAEKEEDLGNAIAKAKREYEIVINCQIWGKNFVGAKDVESYNKQSWKSAGLLHRFYDTNLRPLFDRRNPEREAALLASIPDTGKPWLLVNLTSGRSSPCPSCGSLMPLIEERWSEQYQIVNIAEIRSERFYDCIALLEKAAAICSIDTSWLHLASATNIPVVALVNDKATWAATIVRMNCVAHIMYGKAVANPELIHNAIEKAVQIKNHPLPKKTVDFFTVGENAVETMEQIKSAFEKYKNPKQRRVFHIVDRFDESDTKNLERKKACQESWNALYESGKLIPAHLWDCNYPRNAKDTIGDYRKLCYLKDLMTHGMNQMDDDDILFFSNDDNAISPSLPEYLRFCLGVYGGACSIFRTEFRGKLPSLELKPEYIAKAGIGKHIGRDGFAMTKSWLAKNWDRIPDSILAASMWDIHVAALIRLDYDIKTTNKNIGEQMFPAEIPDGYTAHLFHHSAWNVKDAHLVPSNMHNGKLFKEFAAKHLPELKVTAEGNLA